MIYLDIFRISHNHRGTHWSVVAAHCGTVGTAHHQTDIHGAITSYTCDTCYAEGRRFTTMEPWGQPMLGSPICLVCMHDPQVECTVCGVTVYDWMD